MNIQEAIEHCKKEAIIAENCKCTDEHLQLAKWLEELVELRQQRREVLKALIGSEDE